MFGMAIFGVYSREFIEGGVIHMRSNRFDTDPSRREFLQAAGATALTLGLSNVAGAVDTKAPAGKPFWGVFPIGQTPVTPDNKLDLDGLASQVKFCNRGGVAGFAWPQIASGWSTLSEKERMDGAEAIIAAGKGGKTSVVIGVQSADPEIATCLRYAKHAAQTGADAIIALPPDKADDEALIEYYKTIGAATELPLVVQTKGDMSVDLIVEMFRQIPTMKCVKDEAGDPLARVTEIRERTNNKLAVFSGRGVRMMLEEMRLGFSGHCPTTGLADLFQSAFDLWHAGKHREGFDMFGRIQAFETIPGAGQYILQARGILKEDATFRNTPGMGDGRRNAPLDDAAKKVVRDALDQYLKPYLRG
jgi:4-hydroxy-tetrahydrodipicolinate synthase